MTCSALVEASIWFAPAVEYMAIRSTSQNLAAIAAPRYCCLGPSDGARLTLADLTFAQLGSRYRSVTPVGAGATAAVYRARDVWEGRDVAIKMLRSEIVSAIVI